MALGPSDQLFFDFVSKYWPLMLASSVVGLISMAKVIPTGLVRTLLARPHGPQPHRPEAFGQAGFQTLLHQSKSSTTIMFRGANPMMTGETEDTKAVRILTRQLKELEEVRGLNYKDAKFKSWHDDTMRALQRFLSPDSPHLGRFRNLRFIGPGV
jgi:hypothetical protein